ncbi:hypothetical protein Btru_057745 [Bulinus truncatus]|nr:hypothetical protein Btru_057745 [Bulinus truncatus]
MAWLYWMYYFLALTVTVFAINRPPACSSSFYTVNVTEDDATATVSSQNLPVPVRPTVSCTDPENDQLVYSFYNDTGHDLDKLFVLDPATGNLTWRTKVDADVVIFQDTSHKGPFVMAIAVNDTHNNTFIINVLVQIWSINDNDPIITRTNATFTLPENTTVGTTLNVCNLTDADLPGSGHDVPYVRIKSGNTDGVFSLDYRSCDLTLVRPLDYETKLNVVYDLVLEAYDVGLGLPGSRNTTAAVQIFVSDVNDNVPTCSPNIIMVSVLESIGFVPLATLNCTDVETPNPPPIGLNFTIVQNKFTFVLTDSWTDPRLQIHPKGIIYMRMIRPLDYEKNDRNLSMLIRVRDTSNDTVLSTTVTFIMLVKDVDDKAPQFHAPYDAMISESAAIGDVVMTVNATDADSPNSENSRIAYGLNTACTPDWFSIDPDTVSHIFFKRGGGYVNSMTGHSLIRSTATPFTVNQTTGIVTLTKAGSIENETSIQFKIQATVSIWRRSGYAVGQFMPSRGGGYVNSMTGHSLIRSTATPFTVNQTTGIVTLTKAGSIENETSIQFKIQAIDQGTPARTAETYVNIRVLHINDHDPVIQNTVKLLNVTENSPPGTSVYKVVATDADHGLDGTLNYTLVNNTSPFILEADTGDLLVGLGLDADGPLTQYNLTVLVSDRSSTQVRTATMTLSVVVTDVNDNPPVCPYVKPKDLTNQSLANPILQFSCQADLTGSNLKYNIVGGNTNGIFTLDQGTGVLRIATAAPAGIYYLVVKVSDNGSPSLSTTMTVEFTLDKTLKFKDFPQTTIHVNEITNVNTSVVNITTEGTYETVLYSVIGGNGMGVFSIHQLYENVRLAQPLDRELTSYYTVVISAEIPSGQTATGTLTVTVDDYNDNSPLYSTSYYTQKVMENVTIPQILGTFTATDKDSGINAVITYSICSGDPDGTFHYNPSNGSIRVIKKLDHTKTQAYYLVLCAKDSGIPSLNSSAILHVIVENVDEFAPTIIPSVAPVSLTLSEDTTIGSRVLIINGSDPNGGSLLNYTLYNATPPGIFFIDEHTGYVYLIYPLDRETLASMSFGVKVTNAIGQSVNTSVNVIVADANDNDPVYDPFNYAFSMADATAGNTNIGKLFVSDKDVGVNGSVVLTITSGDTNGTFKITDFNLTSNAVLYADTQNKYDLIVTATDKGSPPRSSSAFVTVNIKPRLKLPSFYPNNSDPVTLNETHPVGSLIKDMDATLLGATEGSSGDLIYSIQSGDSTNEFYIEPFKGQIQLVSALSFAKKAFYSLVILAQNRNNLSISSTILVNITVLQVNLFTPLFSSDLYNWTVNETSPLGTSVGKVQATDPDIGQFGNVTYSIKSGLPFKIDSLTGVITLNGALDWTQVKSYSFYVTATDNAGASSKSSSSVVIITVTDLNDHAPTFSSSVYNITLPESFPLNQAFLFVKASHTYSGSTGVLVYSITSGNGANKFAIDKAAGSMSLTDNLDFETVKNYNLSVKAVDGRNPPKSATADVFVVVTDTNDNAPVFATSRVELNISTATPAMTSVHTVSAHDADILTNSEFYYVIKSGNSNNLFSIDPISGLIQTTTSLQSSSGFYNLVVAAVDQGFPPLTGTTMVSIVVKPVINLAYDLGVYENKPAGTVAGRVRNMNAPSYTIQGGNFLNSFTVNSSGHLVTTRVLDREDYGFFQLLIAQWDTQGAIDSTFIVKVQVLDENDHTPTFTSNPLNIYVVENTLSGTIAGQLTATDLDEFGNANSAITYTISPLSKQGGQYFTVDGATGQITLKQTIDYEAVPSMSFQVIAKDGGTPQLSATATVNVIVYDVPETNIQHGFNTTYFTSHEFPHDAAQGDVVCSLIPEDFGLDPTVNRKNVMTSVGNNVFNVSRAALVTVNLRERIYENGRYFQWVVMTTSDATNTTTLMGLIRLDTFNKDKHLVAVVMDMDESTLKTNKDQLLADLQAKFPAPQKVKIWDIQTTTSVTTRRRLLAAESAAFIFVLADNASDSIDNVDMMKTFLTQSEILSQIQDNKKGTPVSGLSTLPVKLVAPYTDVTTDNSMDTAMIVLIVFAVIAGIIVIAVIIALLVYCLYCRRKKDEDTKDLVKKEEKKKDLMLGSSKKPAPRMAVRKNEPQDSHHLFSHVNDTDNYLLPSQTDQSWTSEKYVDKEAKLSDDEPPDSDADGEPTKPVVATYVTSTLDDPLSIKESLNKLTIVEEDETKLRNLQPFGLAVPIVIKSVAIKVTDGKLANKSGMIIENRAIGNLRFMGVKSIRIDLKRGVFAQQRPVCSPSFYTVNVTEDATGPAAGTAVSVSPTDINCTDADNDTLVYTFYNDTGGDLANLLTLESTTGKLKWARNVDAEEVIFTDTQYRGPFMMTIAVNDNITEPSIVNVLVQIWSINDNAPSITIASSTYTLLENTTVGTTMKVCSLTDADLQGSGHDVPYVRIKSGDPYGVFAIDKLTCELTLVRSLNFDNETTYVLELEAYDVSLGAADSKIGTATVTVTVQDVNNHAPTCSPYTIVTSQLESIPTTTVLATLNCTDVETPTPLNYLIVQQSDSRLNINATTGKITINATLDYEKNDRNLSMLVQVSDTSTDTVLSTTVTFIMLVTDVDDEIPAFNDPLSATISESAVIGDVVMTVNATDADSPNSENSRITYGLNKACTPDWFSIDPVRGTIYVNSTFDRTIAMNVTCPVQVYSFNQTAKTNTTTVTITIAQYNKYTPVFTQSLYTGSLLENSPAGYSVLTVLATDGDSSGGINGQIKYIITTAGPFAVDPTSGVVTLINMGGVDYEIDTFQLISIKAVDQGTPARTAETYVNIQILPVNEHDPVIQNTVKLLYVAENSSPGNSVYKVLATDADHGLDGTLNYTLVNNNSPFILEADTGDLRVGLGLDADGPSSQYNLTVLVSDRSNTQVRTATMTLSVVVTDVNDNPPVCTYVPPTDLSNQNLTSPILQFSCRDVDQTGSVLQYSIAGGNTTGIFTLDKNTGVLRIATIAPAGTYYLVVKVSDNGSPSLSTTMTVEFMLDLKLKFQNFPATILHVNEITNVTTSVVNITTEGTYETVQYSVIGGNGMGVFSIHQLYGNVRLAQPLDRELTSYYTVVISAKIPSGQTATGTLTVTVDDYNDNSPLYSTSYYTQKVMENVTISQVIGTFTATDKDTGNNALITYIICSGDPDGTFYYNPSSGIVSVMKKLDFEKTQAYNLFLCAKDSGIPSLNSSAILHVIVENVDEFAPTIIPSVAPVSLTLSEDTTIGSRVLIINGSDQDHGSVLNYTLFNEAPTGMFFIDEHTGYVYLIYPLDRETLASMSFGVKVTNPIGQSVNTTVNVIVTDVNDNEPFFDPFNYVFSMPDATAANTNIGKLFVSDKDAGVNGSVVLTITSGDPSSRFKITGFNLTSNVLLYADTQNKYDLIVTATDKGSPSRSSSAFVTVHIQPRLKLPSFYPNNSDPVTLNETHPVGSLVKDMDATLLGATEGSSGDLIYSIQSGDPTNTFYIEPYEGHIQLVSALSFAKKPFYSLVILAQNRNKLSLSSTVTVNITVLQVNIYTPQFGSDLYTWTVNETANLGTSVGKVQATDSDVGQFGVVTYSMKSGVPFKIASSTGIITVDGALEYSQAKSYSFYVTATDNAGASSKSSSSVVIITVTDFNNHAPTFSSSVYSITLPESFPLGQVFLVAKASDLDSGSFGTLAYSIISGNGANKFSIDQSAGSLTLAAILDFETVKTYNLTVKAIDGGSPPKSATAVVFVVVTDTNDNAPVFTTSRVELNISTSTPAMTSVHTVSASDADILTNSEFYYVIKSGNDKGLFSIDIKSGLVKTTTSLQSSSGFYSLTVIAVDNGSPSLTGTTLVNIVVKPVINLAYDLGVYENEPVGTVAGRVQNMNAPSYTIQGGNFQNSFTVNSTGHLVTTRVLDREDYGFFQLLIAQWNTLGAINNTFTVNVKVLDKNDNTPTFTSNPLTIYVVENTLSGTIAGQLTATDLDESGNANSAITYTISPLSKQGGQYFTVDSTTGQITLKQTIDYETVSSMTFQVIAKDGGTPQLSATATVNVKVYNVPETYIQHGFNTTYFISHEFPHDAAQGDVVCSLIPEDFGLDPTVNRKNETTSVGNNVFNVSRAGVVTVNLRERIFENGRYFQWVVMTTTDPTNTTTLMGLIRLDTFNKDKHLVAVVMNMDESTLKANKDKLLADLQVKFPAPKKVKIWDIQTTTSVTTRRRLLAAESAAFILVLADSAPDSINNVDTTKTFLTQSEILSQIQSSKDGTPVSGLSSLSVKKVAPYTDVTTDNSMDTAMIVLIVFAVIAGIILIAVIIALLVYCLYCRRKKDEDRKELAPTLTTLNSKPDDSHHLYSRVNDTHTDSYLLPAQTDRSWTSQKYIDKDVPATRSEARIPDDEPPDYEADGEPTRPVVATYVSSTLDDPLSSTGSLKKLTVVEENELETSHA